MLSLMWLGVVVLSYNVGDIRTKDIFRIADLYKLNDLEKISNEDLKKRNFVDSEKNVENTNEDDFKELLKAFKNKKETAGLSLTEDGVFRKEAVDDSIHENTNEHFLKLREILSEVDRRFNEAVTSNNVIDELIKKDNENPHGSMVNSVEPKSITELLFDEKTRRSFNFYVEQRDSLKTLESLIDQLSSSKNEKRGAKCLKWDAGKCVRVCRSSVWCY